MSETAGAGQIAPHGFFVGSGTLYDSMRISFFSGQAGSFLARSTLLENRSFSNILPQQGCNDFDNYKHSMEPWYLLELEVLGS